MVTRKSHKKSRNGCADCKRRKVKCDETRPVCFNCTRHGVACSLSAKPATTRGRESARDSPSTPGTAIGSSSTPSANHMVTTDTISGSSTIPITWQRDIELTHHYTMSTAETLAHRSDMRHTWRVTVPEMAFDCPFVLHGILAVSALHKAYVVPTQRDTYLCVAAAHQNSGLEGFRAALPSMSSSYWKEHLVFASTICLSVCMMPIQTCSDGIRDESAPSALGLFSFVKGMLALIHPYQQRLWGTTLSPFIQGVWPITESDPAWFYPAMDRTPLPADSFEAVARLREHFLRALTGFPEISNDYQRAIDDYEKALYLVAHAGSRPEMGMLLFIPYTLPESVMMDIEALSPHGLVFLSYVAALSNVLEPFFWFLTGWSRRLFSIIDAHLPDHSTCTDIVCWPRKQVFGI